MRHIEESASAGSRRRAEWAFGLEYYGDEVGIELSFYKHQEKRSPALLLHDFARFSTWLGTLTASDLEDGEVDGLITMFEKGLKHVSLSPETERSVRKQLRPRPSYFS